MSDNKLEKIRLRKAEMLLRIQSTSNEVVNINTEDEFNRILKTFPDKVMIIDFWADWCSPCKTFSPIFARAQQEYSSDFIFAKVNIDENPKIVQHFRITSIPTTLFLKKNQVLRKLVGDVNFETLRQMLEKFKG